MIRPPYRIRDNHLQCGNCGGNLPGRAAGANIEAHYAGPVLMGVNITTSRGVELHACGANEAEKAKAGERQ